MIKKIKIIKVITLLFFSFLMIGCEELTEEQTQEINRIAHSGDIIRGIIRDLWELKDCGSGDTVCMGTNGHALKCLECEVICEAQLEPRLIGDEVHKIWVSKGESPGLCNSNERDINSESFQISGATLAGTELAGGELFIKIGVKVWNTYSTVGRLGKETGKGRDPDNVITRLEKFEWDATFHFQGSLNIGGKSISFDEEKTVKDKGGAIDTCKTSTGSKCPDLINLKDFTVINKKNDTYLTWTTGMEVDNAGFHIWRSEEEDGEYVRITDSLVPTQGNNSQYTFIDKNIKDGKSYYYKLEDIAFCGRSTFRYPISSSSNKVLLIKPTTDIIISSEQVPPKFEWEKGNYSKFKFQFSDNNGQTLYEIPSEWIKGTSMTPPSTFWKNFAEEKKGQTFSWRVVGENEQGQSFFSEMHHLTIR